MQIRIFNIPLTDTGELHAELNRFLAGHKVLEVEQRFFQNEKGGCWSFCVRYLSGIFNPSGGNGIYRILPFAGDRQGVGSVST